MLFRSDRHSGKSRPGRSIFEGARTVLSRTTEYWKSAVADAVNSASGAFRSKDPADQTRAEVLMEQLRTMPVKRVAVANDTVLPPDVVRSAAKRSGLIGVPLRIDRVQELSSHLKRWYVRKGYLMHGVTGAVLDTDTATANITVYEPKISKLPVSVV